MVSKLRVQLIEFQIELRRKQHTQRQTLPKKIFHWIAMNSKKDRVLEILNTKNQMEENLRNKASRQ